MATRTVETKSAPRQSAPAASGRIDGLKICYIGGGSVGWAHSLMNDLALCSQLNGEVRLYDVELERARMNAKYGERVFKHPQAKSKWRWRAVSRLADGLKGVDFVFLSITPGQLEAMAREIEICERYGLYHPVGDTVGPAGLMRGLRTARIYAGFAKAIMEHAPKAWVINYTNPMTICTRALYAAAPEIKAFGCCHEVFGSQGMLSELVEKHLHVPRPRREEIECTVLGINHFTFLTQTSWRGTDLEPLWRRHFTEDPAVRPHYTSECLKNRSVFSSFHCITAALSLRYGVLSASGDRHLSEFVAGFLTSKDELHRWGILITPVREYRIAGFQKRVGEIKKLAAGVGKVEIHPSGEEAIAQLRAILGQQDLMTNVNLPNRGQVSDLPLNAVVETNAYFGRDQVTALSAGKTPRTVRPLLARHVCNQEFIVEAALAKNEDLALAAITNDPINLLPLDKTAALFKELMAATNPWSYSSGAPK